MRPAVITLLSALSSINACKTSKGWVRTTLGELNVPSGARASPSEEPDLPYVGMEHVEAQTMKLIGHGEASEVKNSSVRFNKGDVLRKDAALPQQGAARRVSWSLFCSVSCFSKYRGLEQPAVRVPTECGGLRELCESPSKWERPRVDFEKLARFSYLRAPSREQQRTAAELNSLLQRAAAGESAARRALDGIATLSGHCSQRRRYRRTHRRPAQNSQAR